MDTVTDLQQKIEKAGRVVLFGASGLGEIFLSEFKGSANIVAFIDNDPRKAGTEFSGIPVFGFDDLKDLKPDFIVVTSQYYEQILNQLADFNIPFCHCYDVIVKPSGWRWAKLHFFFLKGIYRLAKWLYKQVEPKPGGF